MRQDLKIKDQLVTGEDFIVSKYVDGVLVTKPVLSEKDLFKYYENKCAVCGITYFLDAAHIIPVKNNGVDHKLNGLILCKNHHKAFDDGFFKINHETLNIEIIRGNKDLLKIPRENIKHLINKPGKKYLEWRYNKYK